MWLIFAFLSALFAALTAIFAKLGAQGINSSVATSIRTFVVLLMCVVLVYVSGAFKDASAISTIKARL